ncbi:MAG: YhfC family intramembrane metalloprotease [Dehalococcoidia bacterium]|nr:YhfC family intramembrane metalloprotease [Dehalococcoidia bacterium]
MSPLTLLNVQAAAVILGPLALGWWLRQRLAVSWRIWGWGALTFLASQLARLPFLFALTALVNPLVSIDPNSPAVFWVNLLVLSLTAGLFEESARWFVLQRFATSARGWRAAVMFGAGHGGVESMLIVGGSTIFGIVLLQLGDSMMAQTEGDLERSAVAAQLDALRSLQWWEALLAIWERTAAMTFHIGAAVVVMQAVVSGQRIFWVVAVLGHALFNAAVLAALQFGGAVWAEIVATLFALSAAYMILRFRWLERRQPADRLEVTDNGSAGSH